MLKVIQDFCKYAVTKNEMMSQSEAKEGPIKVAGYLEKRSKMRVVCRWKKLWFVLEGRLLLYYKSQLEYLSLSPCRGSVNLGLAACVAPGKYNEITVSTRSNTISLRALNRTEYDIWLQALMDAMHLTNTNISHNIFSNKPVRHFRYSTGGLEDQNERKCSEYLMSHSHTLSGRISPVIQGDSEYVKRRPQNTSNPKSDQYVSRRLSKIGASDNAIPENCKTSPRNSTQTLRRSVSVEEEVNRHSENIYETVDTKKQLRDLYPRKVYRSDSDRLMIRERICRPPVFRSEQRIRSNIDLTSDHYDFAEFLHKKRTEASDKRLSMQMRMKYGSSSILEKLKDINTDSDYCMYKDEFNHSGSCSALYQPHDQRNSSCKSECYYYPENVEPYAPNNSSTPLKKAKRSNSILRHFRRQKTDVCSPLINKQSTKRRSLSFLRKIWKKKEPKFEDDFSNNTEIDMQEIIHSNSEDFACSSEYSAVQLSLDYEFPLPEPAPDYGQITEEAPELPPRIIRGPTPWDDPPRKEKETGEEEPPPLPAKIGRRKGKSQDPFYFNAPDPAGLKLLFNEHEECINQRELRNIISELKGMNPAPFHYINSSTNKYDEDPDYDIPRPHNSLLLDIKSEPTLQDSMQPTNFFSNFEDSLDPCQSENYDGFTMAPDSLECDPWSLSENETTYEKWSPKSQSRKTIVSSSYGSNREMYFKDTIKLPHDQTNYLQSGFIKMHS